MNRGYTYYKDGYVIVSDKKGNLSLVKNNGNIQEYLVQENLVESIDSRINFLRRRYDYSYEKKPLFVPRFASLGALVSLSIPVLISIALKDNILLQDINIQSFMVNIGVLTTSTVTPLFAAAGAVIDNHFYYQNKLYFLANQEIKREIAYLRSRLEGEKEKLVELQKHNKHTEIRYTLVKDTNALAQLNNDLVNGVNLDNKVLRLVREK